MYVSQQVASLAASSQTPTPSPDVVIGFLAEDLWGISSKRIVVDGNMYVQQRGLWNVDCAVLGETCLRTITADCLQPVGPCTAPTSGIMFFNGIRYVRNSTEGPWREFAPDDAADPCRNDRAANAAVRGEFVMLSYIEDVASAGEQKLGDRKVAVIEAEFEVPELVPGDGCLLPSSPSTGLTRHRRITLWIDPETMLPAQVYEETETYQGDTLVAREYRLAAYEDFNEAALPRPLPD